MLLIGIVAEKLWSGQRWLIIFFLGGIFSQLVGFLWQPIGAGNSVANFSLAASIVVAGLNLTPSRFMRIAALLVFGAGGILLLLRDIHGAAIAFGAVIALMLIRLDQPQIKRL